MGATQVSGQPIQLPIPPGVFPGPPSSNVARNQLNVVDLGAMANGLTDDSGAFLAGLLAAKAASTTLPYAVASDPVGAREIVIPAGTYLITQPGGLLGAENMTAKLNGLTFKGDGLVNIIFKPSAGAALCNNDYWLNLHFEGINFYAATPECTFMASSTTHNAQRYRFVNCFWDSFKYGCALTGNNNNSEYFFENCHSNRIQANGAFFYVPAAGASDQFLNYWFYGCTHWNTDAPFIDASVGGSFHVFGLDASAFGNGLTANGKLFNLRGIVHAYGVCNFEAYGVRVEPKTSFAGLLYSEWGQGNVTFGNVDFSSSAAVVTTGEVISILTGNENGATYTFDSSTFPGGVTVKWYGNGYTKTPKITFRDCAWLQKTSPSDVVTYDASSASSTSTTPAVVFERCKGTTATNVLDTVNGAATWDAIMGYLGETLQTLTRRELSIRGQYGTPANADGPLTFVLPLGATITEVEVLSPAGATSDTATASWTVATTEGSPTTVATVSSGGPMSAGWDTRTTLAVPFKCSTAARAKLTLTTTATTRNLQALILVKGYW